jgi:hypothetical protein
MTLPTPPRRPAELVIVVGAWWEASLMFWLALALYSAVRTSRLAWQAGYLAARVQLWHGIAEAQRRGLSPAQWLQAEVERDTAPPPDDAPAA